MLHHALHLELGLAGQLGDAARGALEFLARDLEFALIGRRRGRVGLGDAGQCRGEGSSQQRGVDAGTFHMQLRVKVMCDQVEEKAAEVGPRRVAGDQCTCTSAVS